ncbi:MAG: hypothetical protein WDN49_17710 [Acetobacteraceae bacterium]
MPPQKLGAQTADILAEMRYAADQVADMQRAGVFFGNSVEQGPS